MGDADHNGRVDLRVRFFGKVPLLEKEPTQKMCLGPFNVPVEEALRVASQMAALVPAPAAPAVGMVLGAAAGAVGGVQRLMLLPRP